MARDDGRVFFGAARDCAALVIGDVMLDQLIYGDVVRISPEAPVPIFHSDSGSVESFAGGAGNVALNLAELMNRVILPVWCGRDEAGEILIKSITSKGALVVRIVRDHYPTITKTRLVARGQHVMRVDREHSWRQSDLWRGLVMSCLDDLRAMDIPKVVVLSDYQKGAVAPGLAREIIKVATTHKIPVVVDTKSPDLSRFVGAAALKLNLSEIAAVSGCENRPGPHVAESAARIMEQYDIGICAVTMSEAGAVVMYRKDDTFSRTTFNATISNPIDVVGAGDTYLAYLAAGIAAERPYWESAHWANAAAGESCMRKGTAIVRPVDILARLDQQGIVVGMASGCFDILHEGHVAHLQEAAKRCDRLVVAINSDESVRRLKGIGRPIVPDVSRAAVLRSLRCVHSVEIFHEDTPEAIIRRVRPNVVFKGGDYDGKTLSWAEAAREVGARVEILPRHNGSTSAIISRMADAATESGVCGNAAVPAGMVSG